MSQHPPFLSESALLAIQWFILTCSELRFIFVSLEVDQQLLRQVENVWAGAGSTSPTGHFWWWGRCWKDATLIPERLYIPDIWRTAGRAHVPGGCRSVSCLGAGCDFLQPHLLLPVCQEVWDPLPTGTMLEQCWHNKLGEFGGEDFWYHGD